MLNDAQHNLVSIEDNLRILSKGSNTNVLAFYDMSRSKLESFPNLKRGGGENDFRFETTEEFAENYQYMHIGTHFSMVVLPVHTSRYTVVLHWYIRMWSRWVIDIQR